MPGEAPYRSLVVTEGGPTGTYRVCARQEKVMIHPTDTPRGLFDSIHLQCYVSWSIREALKRHLKPGGRIHDHSASA